MMREIWIGSFSTRRNRRRSIRSDLSCITIWQQAGATIRVGWSMRMVSTICTISATLTYYHDRSNLEADCVLHLSDGRYALIEFKLGSREIEEGAQNLLQIKQLVRTANASGKTNLREPDLLMVITGGELAYTRPDGVKIIPIGCLRD